MENFTAELSVDVMTCALLEYFLKRSCSNAANIYPHDHVERFSEYFFHGDHQIFMDTVRFVCAKLDVTGASLAHRVEV